ncbi:MULTISPECIES: UDP-3-O-(3-hydroxymyristoyl)glucosamine N-acyltransferase [Phnomibacter]|uniref:UDP-3-O-acylglucosamine N-acyltransferase n=1 Tax=Phnomibacter ginsenosidimutans TaxID=2676868 RepID=A0A6I6G411_9BACT|nr:UDP-3-O-(3-hydroxymyristoyl)glucosamine N-acyltransferase [Phnomibacter ginsenosidimutans]MCA0380767.1 UDP-3-O-(3-hydroxymyristoyl)glucosamine N-acyltransferase [Bacteroidota bacterium]QGW26737.1 UDP-3-O-(3-hydroxymyristoyl)glucosamine N-acyltransferase [Phnomibacter ginsenosidimutans]
MTFSAATIAQLAGGRVEGNAQAAVSGFGKIEEAQAGQLAFLANPKYEEYLYTTQASVVIVNESLELKQAVQATLIRVPDAYSAFAALLSQYEAMQRQMLSGREEPSFVHDTATMGNDVYIGAFAYIGKNVRIGNNVKIYPQVFIGDDVTIGDNTVLNPGVKVYHRCVLGKNVIVHAGTVIGSDGFGFAPQADGTFKKVPQMGNVVLEDDVEVGSNSTIDRATIGSTMVHAGAKIDNLVQIAHNVEIGSHTVIAAQTGISGSTKVGKGVMIGGQVGIVGHIKIGDGAKINAQSGVSKSLDNGKAVTGSPAYDYTSALRSQAVSRRLPELEKKVKELEAAIAALKAGG